MQSVLLAAALLSAQVVDPGVAWSADGYSSTTMPLPRTTVSPSNQLDVEAPNHGGGPPLEPPRHTAIWPLVHKTYAPGTLPNPSGSWFKHPYLAYRGNYYLGGFDYRMQFDYPWHKSAGGCCAGGVRPAMPREPIAPDVGEPVPTPLPEPRLETSKRSTERR